MGRCHPWVVPAYIRKVAKQASFCVSASVPASTFLPEFLPSLPSGVHCNPTSKCNPSKPFPPQADFVLCCHGNREAK